MLEPGEAEISSSRIALDTTGLHCILWLHETLESIRGGVTGSRVCGYNGGGGKIVLLGQLPVMLLLCRVFAFLQAGLPTMAMAACP